MAARAGAAVEVNQAVTKGSYEEMKTMYRMTSTGPESLIPHLSIQPAPATGETVVRCSACGATLRVPARGWMPTIEAFMLQHADHGDHAGRQ